MHNIFDTLHHVQWRDCGTNQLKAQLVCVAGFKLRDLYALSLCLKNTVQRTQKRYSYSYA